MKAAKHAMFKQVLSQKVSSVLMAPKEHMIWKHMFGVTSHPSCSSLAEAKRS